MFSMLQNLQVQIISIPFHLRLQTSQFFKKYFSKYKQYKHTVQVCFSFLLQFSFNRYMLHLWGVHMKMFHHVLPSYDKITIFSGEPLHFPSWSLVICQANSTDHKLLSSKHNTSTCKFLHLQRLLYKWPKVFMA